jgi:adenosylhomocysteine nucleosidase
MDARPIFKRHEIPLLDKVAFAADEELRAKLVRAAEKFLNDGPPADAKGFAITKPRVHVGAIASGDQFFAEKERVAELHARLPDVFCVEMEGAAVAQVCYEHGVRFAIFQTISDSADENAPVDFQQFTHRIAGVYSREVLRELFSVR